jgi:hypothetical protein
MSLNNHAGKPEDDQDEYDYDARNPWNRREKKSELPQYVLLAVLCLILAYALSNAVH